MTPSKYDSSPSHQTAMRAPTAFSPQIASCPPACPPRADAVILWVKQSCLLVPAYAFIQDRHLPHLFFRSTPADAVAALVWRILLTDKLLELFFTPWLSLASFKALVSRFGQNKDES
eukprot:jgi/Picsp_1/4007/NSC_01518-R1_---NA---